MGRVVRGRSRMIEEEEEPTMERRPPSITASGVAVA